MTTQNITCIQPETVTKCTFGLEVYMSLFYIFFIFQEIKSFLNPFGVKVFGSLNSGS